MSFATKADLKTAIDDWMARSDISGNADDRITLCEAKLNRALGEVLTYSTLTGVLNSREISVSSLSIAEPLALYLAETGLDEVEVKKMRDGTFPYFTTSSRPKMWAYIDGAAKVVFDYPLSDAYPFRLKYRQRFSLAADGDTNWLLTNHPDIYLAAAAMWGGFYTGDQTKMSVYASILADGIPELQNYISAQNRGELSVDPALVGGRGGFNFDTGL
jgi:hypothetical protein